MEKDRIIYNTMAGLTDLPGLPGPADSKSRCANDSLYPETDELANALCLVNLIISRNRIRRNAPPSRPGAGLVPEGTGHADV